MAARGGSRVPAFECRSKAMPPSFSPQSPDDEVKAMAWKPPEAAPPPILANAALPSALGNSPDDMRARGSAIASPHLTH
eukprot:1157831-Pelagomonas_calceolata.AAC.6